METWTIILIIILSVITTALAGFLIWWFLLRKKEEPDRYMRVTCSTCGGQIDVDKYAPPKHIVCPSCGKEGPVKMKKNY